MCKGFFDKNMGCATKSFEIYFNDLNEKTQKAYLEFEGVEDESELNHEISPLAIIDREIEEESEDGKTNNN